MPLPKISTHAAIDERIRLACLEAGHSRVAVRFAAYAYAGFDNLDEVAAEGLVVLYHDNLYGGRPWSSGLLNRPTWLQVAVAANEAIIKTRDPDHHFLEYISFRERANGVNHYKLGMGS